MAANDPLAFSYVRGAQIELEEAEFSRASLEHYGRMLVQCHEHSLMPMLAFHHSASPR